MRIFLASVLFIGLIAGCKKEKEDDNNPSQPTTDQTTLNLSLRFEVDGSQLQFNNLQYTNAAGNNYSVSTLVFYLSEISLMKSDSSLVSLKDYLYVDAQSSATLNIPLTGIPNGCYSALCFNIGIDSAHNVHGGLPATAENLAMEWPDPMGGGYHFLRLEGYFSDTSGTPGFAMHVGTNNCLIGKIYLPASLCFQNNHVYHTLVMNVNEWFRNPQVYDFNTDGNYSMGNMAAMMKLVNNGRDVFSIE